MYDTCHTGLSLNRGRCSFRLSAHLLTHYVSGSVSSGNPIIFSFFPEANDFASGKISIHKLMCFDELFKFENRSCLNLKLILFHQLYISLQLFHADIRRIATIGSQFNGRITPKGGV